MLQTRPGGDRSVASVLVPDARDVNSHAADEVFAEHGGGRPDLRARLLDAPPRDEHGERGLRPHAAIRMGRADRTGSAASGPPRNTQGRSDVGGSRARLSPRGAPRPKRTLRWGDRRGHRRRTIRQERNDRPRAPAAVRLAGGGGKADDRGDRPLALFRRPVDLSIGHSSRRRPPTITIKEPAASMLQLPSKARSTIRVSSASSTFGFASSTSAPARHLSSRRSRSSTLQADSQGVTICR